MDDSFTRNARVTIMLLWYLISSNCQVSPIRAWIETLLRFLLFIT